MLERSCSPGVVRSAEANGTGLDSELSSSLVATGWAELWAAPDASGFSQLEVLLFELGRAAAPVPFRSGAVGGVFLAHGLGGFDSAAELLNRAIQGEVIVSAVTEQSPDGPHVLFDSKQQLVGEKSFVLDATSAGEFLVLANSESGAVWATAAPSADVSIQHSLSIGGELQSRVSFRNADATSIGPATPETISGWQTASRFVQVAWGAGLLSRVLEMATLHVTERVQFKRAIGSFQAVQHMLADVAVGAQAVASLSAHSARVLAANGLAAREAQSATIESLLALRSFGAAALSSTHQVFGGVGVTLEHDFQLFSRRLRSQLMLGDDSTTAGNQLLELRELV